MAERKNRKVRMGVVVSNKMQKSIVVKVVRSFVHPTYGKIVRRNTCYVAHDEKNECGIGDMVRIVETRPFSRTKHWRLETILEKAK